MDKKANITVALYLYYLKSLILKKSFKHVSFLPNCLRFGHCLGNEAIIELAANGVCTMPHICSTLWGPSWTHPPLAHFSQLDYFQCPNKWLAPWNKAEGFCRGIKRDNQAVDTSPTELVGWASVPPKTLPPTLIATSSSTYFSTIIVDRRQDWWLFTSADFDLLSPSVNVQGCGEQMLQSEMFTDGRAFIIVTIMMIKD